MSSDKPIAREHRLVGRDRLGKVSLRAIQICEMEPRVRMTRIALQRARKCRVRRDWIALAQRDSKERPRRRIVWLEREDIAT